MNDSIEGINSARFGLAEVLPLNTITVPPYTTTNSVIYGKKKFVIIDPAPKEKALQDLLIRHLAERIKQDQVFLGIYLTHHHGDHTGAAACLRDVFKVPIGAHQKAARQLPFSIDHDLRDSEEILVDDNKILRAIHSPGHADSHVVYYAPDEEVLIAGDMITDRGCVLIPPSSGSLRIYLESLNSLSFLKLQAIIPAHGQIIKDEPEFFLIKALKHRFGRILAILHVLENEDRSLDATEITMAVYQGTISEGLLPFAQLSVESSLGWLLANALVAQGSDHRWFAMKEAELIKEKFLLSVVEKLDQRLGNS